MVNEVKFRKFLTEHSAEKSRLRDTLIEPGAKIETAGMAVARSARRSTANEACAARQKFCEEEIAVAATKSVCATKASAKPMSLTTVLISKPGGRARVTKEECLRFAVKIMVVLVLEDHAHQPCQN